MLQVQGMRRDRQIRGSEGVAKPKPKALQGAGKKVANPMQKRANKTRRGSSNPTAKVAPR